LISRRTIHALLALSLVVLVEPHRQIGQAVAEQLDCVIQPGEIIAISAPVEGVVEQMLADRGDRVRRGDVVAVLESTAERAALAVAKARAEQMSAIESSKVRVDFGIRRYLRTDEMYRKNLIPLKDLDEAETAKILAELSVKEAQEAVRVAELEHERARALLEQRVVRSPVAAVVMERLRSPGELTDRERPLLKLARLDPLRVDVVVPLALYGKVTVGQPVEVTPEPPLNRARRAVVIAVGPVADAASGTFGVRLELPNVDYRVPGGLKCQARFLPVPRAPASRPPAARRPASPTATHTPR
jgi:RND family efflux transporter MFP subunit